jgi:pyroglutamyl-peptidase
MTRPVALLTGFEPFRQWRVNSSGEAVRLLAARGVAPARILPVDHEAAAAALGAALAETRPDILLLTGLADAPAPRLELVARRPEHLGGGEAARAGLWPWAAALDALRAAETPARLSRDAGRYVCETSYWAALGDAFAGAGPRMVAFLHVPPLSEAWSAERVAAAVAACLGAGLAASGRAQIG